jgi:tRNA 5-methylaminomethyl-2-thiouridine biosynthesis bifunctional protein
LKWQGDSLWIESARVIDPAKIFDDFEIRRESFEMAQDSSRHSHIFLAAGYGIQSLAPDLAMRFSRGQLSWAKPVWEQSKAYGGYAINLDGAALVGATHDRLGSGNPFELRDKDDVKNLSALAAISGQPVTPAPGKSRASVRVTTPDTLPLMAKVSENIWALTGLGSRGFTFAPLLAESLVAQICGEVGPLDKDLRAKFSALR